MKRECLSITLKGRKRRKLEDRLRPALLLSHHLKNISRELNIGIKISIWLSLTTTAPTMDRRESILIDPSKCLDKAMLTEERTSLIQAPSMLPKPPWDLWLIAKPYLMPLQWSKLRRMTPNHLKEVTDISHKKCSSTWLDNLDLTIMVTYPDSGVVRLSNTLTCPTQGPSLPSLNLKTWLSRVWRT